jgi:hypothetical protein
MVDKGIFTSIMVDRIKKAPGQSGAFFFVVGIQGGSVIHAAHAAVRHRRRRRLLLRPLGDHGLGGDQEGDCCSKGRAMLSKKWFILP